ncbi:MAG: hypothetical protein F4Z75_08995 [Synechococcus sp. SB0668_bin_15]|nr:hypothetical protein [Synechococcus sp. SB0668_bin_15]MXZ83782.1 hypothetical protein [Synechococcus sp. SB0666_bin_14]MYA90269.1 hypothetical protein [Synechococcus sp. SB0663_bin_10]MYC50618.1 hypothetical protein [Synechococcus sp. SB0662_bin_14]MYG47275.1 hypothetical protein [Synechococcus sp. SB0675_bin_6]MYJ60540.1 hypothetical protein [Synechococcus sp. SB0672_bin_6]MYK92088.1 hypothetical protein [Synechococcus sp. SB0669_bin_8]
MAGSNTHNRQVLRDSTQARRQTLMDSLQVRSQLARRNGDIPAQQALYREAVALGLPLDCLDQ